MRLSSIIAIYTLFWSLAFFLVLPFRLKVRGAIDRPVPGQADSAPASFSFGRTCGWTTLVALVLFLLYYFNYTQGWIRPELFDLHAATAG